MLVVDEANCLRDPPLPTVEEKNEQERRTGRHFDYVLWATGKPYEPLP